MSKSPMSPIGRLLVADRQKHKGETRVAQAKRLRITEGALRHFEAGRRVPDVAVCGRMITSGIDLHALSDACVIVTKRKAAEVAAAKKMRAAVRAKHKAQARRIRSDYSKP